MFGGALGNVMGGALGGVMPGGNMMGSALGGLVSGQKPEDMLNSIKSGYLKSIMDGGPLGQTQGAPQLSGGIQGLAGGNLLSQIGPILKLIQSSGIGRIMGR